MTDIWFFRAISGFYKNRQVYSMTPAKSVIALILHDYFEKKIR